jgi:hypothetical protein
MADANPALAELVYRLREQLASLQAAVNTLTADGGEHDHPDLLLALQVLTQTMQGHIEAEEERLTAQAAPMWAGLSQEDYAEQLGRLAEFVDGHLRLAYPSYWGEILRDCWPGHTEALWELGNLSAEWHRIYDRSRPSLDGALTWHDRWMPGVRARLQPVMRGCRAVHCGRRTGGPR